MVVSDDGKTLTCSMKDKILKSYHRFEQSSEIQFSNFDIDCSDIGKGKIAVSYFIINYNSKDRKRDGFNCWMHLNIENGSLTYFDIEIKTLKSF